MNISQLYPLTFRHQSAMDDTWLDECSSFGHFCTTFFCGSHSVSLCKPVPDGSAAFLDCLEVNLGPGSTVSSRSSRALLLMRAIHLLFTANNLIFSFVKQMLLFIIVIYMPMYMTEALLFYLWQEEKWSSWSPKVCSPFLSSGGVLLPCH